MRISNLVFSTVAHLRHLIHKLNLFMASNSPRNSDFKFIKLFFVVLHLSLQAEFWMEFFRNCLYYFFKNMIYINNNKSMMPAWCHWYRGHRIIDTADTLSLMPRTPYHRYRGHRFIDAADTISLMPRTTVSLMPQTTVSWMLRATYHWCRGHDLVFFFFFFRYSQYKTGPTFFYIHCT
jgi:hypothetical protein